MTKVTHMATQSIKNQYSFTLSKSHALGFTIIEMIVSLALFSVVVTISVGALLVLVGTNDRLQVEQNIMTNLSFALDSMSREIRTGTYYYCLSSNSESAKFASSYNLDTLDEDTQDCADGKPVAAQRHGVAFNEAGDSITGAADRILYYYDDVDEKIYRKFGNTIESITSDELRITNADFIVTDSDNLYSAGSDVWQPTVTIFIEAQERSDPNGKNYYVQTTVTQRTLDI
jgi:prepilin-type N-terminal cleavage/methylation domain-containing protein